MVPANEGPPPPCVGSGGKDVVIADAPQRKKRRRRAPRIVFPDPDRGRKPKRIPAVHIKTWEEYQSFMGGGWRVWQIQRTFRHDRLFAASQRQRRARAAARAAAAGPPEPAHSNCN